MVDVNYAEVFGENPKFSLEEIKKMYPLRKLDLPYDALEINKRFIDCRCSTGNVYDMLERKHGLPGRAFAPGIYPLMPHMKVAGPAFTVHAENSPTTDYYKHKTLFGMLESMTPGCIQVRDSGGNDNCGQYGEITSVLNKLHGSNGVVLDGSTRDSWALIQSDYPCFCRFRHPGEALTRYICTDYQIPIYVKGTDGQLLINPGDYIFGDNDGVVVIPKDITLIVLEEIEQYVTAEDHLRADVAAGGDPFEALKKYKSL